MVNIKQGLPSQISDQPPRVLNIHFDDKMASQIPGMTIDASKTNTTSLPFASSFFAVIRASHILHHLREEDTLSVLKEWRRILHKHGTLHIVSPSHAPIKDLDKLLHKAGFTQIEVENKENDIAHQCSINDNSVKTKSTFIAAFSKREPHTHDPSLGEKTFREKCENFIKRHPKNPPTSFIIPIYNEAKNLPQFLTFIENSENRTATKREFIFVINGCTDNSEVVLRHYMEESYLDWRIIQSEKGITPAYKKGIEERKHEGFIGKLDADIVLHPHLLDLMQIHLVENEKLQVTYAEPTPLDTEVLYNANDHHPELMSKRLYFTSKASICREDPFARYDLEKILKGVMAEDIFLSFYYTYFYGLDSIGRTPNGLVYCKTVGNFEDLVKQQSRANSDIDRLFKTYPSFASLGQVMEQEVFPNTPYRELIDQARKNTNYVNEWTRIESTK